MPTNGHCPDVEREDRDSTPTTHRKVYRLSVPAYARQGEAWHSSGIRLEAGQRLEIRATGVIALSERSGLEGPPDGLIGVVAGEGYLAPGLDRYALIGRIGAQGAPFPIGTHADLFAEQPGELELAVNDEWFEYNSGDFEVVVTVR